MKRRLIPACLILAIAASAAGAAQHKDSSDNRGVSPAIAQAPIKTRARRNPFEGQSDAVLAGQKLYRRYCAKCHGENARGMGRAVSLRSPEVQNGAPGELVWFLRNGNLAAGMPSWSGLPEPRRWQIVTYLKTLR